MEILYNRIYPQEKKEGVGVVKSICQSSYLAIWVHTS